MPNAHFGGTPVLLWGPTQDMFLEAVELFQRINPIVQLGSVALVGFGVFLVIAAIRFVRGMV